MFRIALSLLMGLLLSASLGAESVRPAALRVIVPEDAAPMAYRDEAGRLTGFSVEIARALCEEIRAVCHFDVATQHELLDRLLQGKADINMCVPYMRELAESYSNTVVENTPTGILIIDENLNIKQVNPAAAKLLGIDASAVGKPVYAVLPSDGGGERQQLLL